MHINRKLGDYILLRRLAVGGQSEVFLAKKEGPGEFSRNVVIKALPTKYRDNEQLIDLFTREAFLSARFSHPHVITVHDARMLDGEHCMIMDFVSGQTVADIAQRGYKAGQPPSIDQAIRIVADACDGLHHAHQFEDLDGTEYPVVHRDVSPQNLMVTYEGVTIVFDFGIAKIVGREEEQDVLAGGKYAYMSPEQCRSEEVDQRSDIFSLGVILYELSAGTRLFRRPSKEEVVRAVTEEEIPPPSSFKSRFPPMLEDVIMKALERDPDRRYQRAAEMRDELRRVMELRPTSEMRDELGNYVGGLFEEERREIAEVLGEAKELDEPPRPRGGIPLEELGRREGRREGSDPAVPLPEPDERESNVSARSDESGASEAESSDRRAEGSTDSEDRAATATSADGERGPTEPEVQRELEQARGRVRALGVALVVIGTVAATAALLTFLVYAGYLETGASAAATVGVVRE